MSTRRAEKERRKRERVELERKLAEEARRRRRGLAIGSTLLGVLMAAGAVVLIVAGGGASSGGTGGPFGTHYEGLAERRVNARVPTMGEAGGQTHVHAQLTVVANGRRIPVPANIGIEPERPGSDMAGVHTHDESGTIHVEAVESTLGQFFAVWGVPFTATRLGPYRANARNDVRMWVDGKPSRAFGSLKLADGQRILVVYGRRGAPPPSL